MANSRPQRYHVLLFFLFAGILTGICFRAFHNCHHHLSIFYTPEQIEAYIDGECLNTAHPIPIDTPHIDVHFEQPLQRPHRGLFLQGFSKMSLRLLDDNSLFWVFTDTDVPPWAPARKWGHWFLKALGCDHRAGFNRFHPVNLTRTPETPFVLESDLVMPTSLRYHFVDPETKQRNIFGADVFAGAYFFALDELHNRTQRYFINHSMHKTLRNAFLLKVMITLFLAILMLGFCTLLNPLILSIVNPCRTPLQDLYGYLSAIFRPLFSRLTFIQRIPWWYLIPVILATGITWFIASSIFVHLPHVNDEGVYLFQAKVFASGRMYIPPPQPVECFKHLGIWLPDRIFSYYTYGHSLILAFGFLLKIHHLIPVILTAVTILLTSLVTYQVYHSKLTALLAGTLLSISPLFLFLGASYMSHISSMAFNMLFLLFLIRSDSNPKPLYTVLSGAGLGVSFVIRPVTALVFAIVPLLIWTIRKHNQKTVIWMLIFTVLTISLSATAFYHAYATTGNWALIQHQVEDRFDKGNDLTTFWKNLHQNFAWFQTRAFGWLPWFALMFAILPFLLLSPNKWNWVFLTGFCVNAWLYSALAHFGWTHEPRYWSEFMPLIALLSAGGVYRLAQVNKRFYRSSLAGRLAAVYCVGLISLLTWLSLTSYWPYERDVYTDYCGIRQTTWESVKAIEVPDSIILFKGHPDHTYIPHFYRNAVPSFQGAVIYAMDVVPAATQELLNRHPHRKVFLVEGAQPPRQIR